MRSSVSTRTGKTKLLSPLLLWTELENVGNSLQAHPLRPCHRTAFTIYTRRSWSNDFPVAKTMNGNLLIDPENIAAYKMAQLTLACQEVAASAPRDLCDPHAEPCACSVHRRNTCQGDARALAACQWGRRPLRWRQRG